MDISLFEVSSEAMFEKYPELKDIDEFKDLTDKEIKFCWYVANPTSPLAGKGLTKPERYSRAAAIVYGKRIIQAREGIRNMMKGKFERKMIAAIERMSSFEIGIRLKALLLTEYIFEKLNKLVEVDRLKMKSMDFSEKKQYSDLAIKVSEAIPNLVSRIESGYGIKIKEIEKENKIKVGIHNL